MCVCPIVLPSIHLPHRFHPARQISGFCVNPPNASPFVSSNRKIMTGCPTITASEKKPKSFGCREIRSDIPSTY